MSDFSLNDKEIPFNVNVDMNIFNNAKKILNNLHENGYVSLGRVETGKVFNGYNVINFYIKQDQYFKPIMDRFKEHGFIVRKKPGSISYLNQQIVLDKTGCSIDECFSI